MADVQAKLEAKIEQSVAVAVAKDEVQAAPDAGPPIAAQVIKDLLPILLHLTSNEKWWQSRVTLGAMASAAAGILALFGFVIDSETKSFWTELIFQGAPVVLALGGAFASWYGRWKAKKPLGA